MVSNYLKQHPKILKEWAQKDRFMGDFETLSAKNLLTAKSGIKYSAVYLWGIYSHKMNYILWGTEIDDFVKTIMLLIKHREIRKRHFTYFFNNLSWDWEFLKKYFVASDNVINEYEEWKKIKKDYLKVSKKKQSIHKHEGKLTLVKSGQNVIMAQFLIMGCVLTFKCSYRATDLSVKNMGLILKNEGILSEEKLSAKYDYDLVNKVYTRKEFFKKIYGDIDYVKNYFKSDVSKKKGPYKYFLKYLHNDLQIPFSYLKYNERVIQKINQKLSVKDKNIMWLDNRYYIIKKAIPASEKTKDKKYTFLRKAKIIKNSWKTNDKGYLMIRDKKLEKQKKIKLSDALDRITYLTNYELTYLKNLQVKIAVGKKVWFEMKRIKDIIPYDSLTVSSKAFVGWKNHYGKNFVKDFGKEDKNILDWNSFDIINRSFCGGLTNYNQSNMGWKNEKWDIISFDLNSSYPYQMQHKLPYGKPLKKMPKNTTWISFSEYNIISFKPKKEWKNKFPPFFPTWKTIYNKKDIIENLNYMSMPSYLYNYKEKNGNFNACFDNEEWNLLNKYYDIDYKKIKTIYFKTKFILRKYITALKEIKLNAKTKPERDYGKLMMNSIYGKTAQNLFLDEDYYLETTNINKKEITNKNKEFSVKHRKTGEKQKVLSNFKYDNLMEIRKKPKNVFEKHYAFLTYYGLDRSIFSLKINKQLKNDYLQCRQVGGIITSRARAHLINTIMKIGWDNIKYFDTDSIYFYDNKETKKIIKEIAIDNKKIGSWCFEKKMEKMKILGPKKYQLKIKAEWNGKKWVKCDKYEYRVAGLKNANENFEKVGHDKFYDGYVFKNVNVKKQVLDSGVVLNEPVDYVLEKKFYKNF